MSKSSADMVRGIFCLSLLLLSGCLANPVPEDNPKPELTKYVYSGFIDTKSTADSDSVARWTIHATLSILHFNGKEEKSYTYLKLSDVKTSLFNGKVSDLGNTKEKLVKEEVEIIEQPFFLHYDRGFNFTLHFKPSDPLWSINLKRGVANLLNFEFEKPEILPNGEYADLKVPVVEFPEVNLFGNCIVRYTRVSATPEEGVVYEKTYDYLNCSQPAIHVDSRKKHAPGYKSQDLLQFNFRHTLKLAPGKQLKTTGHSNKLHIAYKTSPSAEFTFHVDQQQKLTFVEKNPPTEQLDESSLAEYTLEKDLEYEFGDDFYGGRRVYEKDPEKLAQNYLKHYDEFIKVFNFSPVKDDTQAIDLLYDMNEDLEHITVEGLRKIQKIITEERADDWDVGYFFISLVANIGTNETVRYLSEFYSDKKVDANPGFSTWMLFSFPQRINDPVLRNLVDLEKIIDNKESEYKMVKNAALFGFAKGVSEVFKRDGLIKEDMLRYNDLYNSKFLGGKNYEERLVGLLGFINMAEVVGYDFFEKIATNTSELSSLRILAIGGFKKYIIQDYEIVDRVYNTYWPIVQKRFEPFEVRVLALDLLLGCKLSEEQFNTILQKYSGDLNEPEDRQLANYLITSLHSLQNSTGYEDNLGALASEAIKTTTIRPISKALATGNYRLAFTDSAPNFGAAFEGLAITDPKTNIINTICVSFNSFANTFDYGTYTLYLKFEGVSEYILSEQSFFRFLSGSSLPEVLKLLKENDYEITDPYLDVHIDVVLFIDNVAIYANHFDNFKGEHIKAIASDFEELLTTSSYVSLPIDSYLQIPSILGTPIIINNYITNIENHEKKHETGPEFEFRSSGTRQNWLESYNPLIDVNTAVYSYQNDETYVRLLNITNEDKEKFPPTRFTWINNDQTFIYTWQNNIGTAVDNEKKLEEYCETCAAYNEVSLEGYKSWTNSLEPLGISVEAEKYVKDDAYHPKMQVLEEVIGKNLHRANVDVLPMVGGPVLLLADIYYYKNLLRSDVSKGSFKINPANHSSEPLKTQLTLDMGHSSRNGFIQASSFDAKLGVEVKNLEDEEISKVNFTIVYYWDPNYSEDENKTEGVGSVYSRFYFHYKSPNANRSVKVCGSCGMAFPKIRSDRLSLKPYEQTVGRTNLVVAENTEDDEDCIPKVTVSFVEVLTTTDKTGTPEEKKLSKDHEKCLADSKDLKFTAPTKECKRVADRLTEYDSFQAFGKVTRHLDGRNETIADDEAFISWIHSENKIDVNISLSKIFEFLPNEQRFDHYELYFPHMTINPSWLAYGESELDTATSTCTVTPSFIEKFSGKTIQNPKKEWLAFAECVNETQRALNGHTIDEKHVGFTFYSNEHVLEATVKGGKPAITLDGKPITKDYYPEDLSIRITFINDEAVYIKDSRVAIYYNTEYVYTKVHALYPKQVLCGLCIHEI